MARSERLKKASRMGLRFVAGPVLCGAPERLKTRSKKFFLAFCSTENPLTSTTTFLCEVDHEQ